MALDTDKEAEIEELRAAMAPTRRATVPALEEILYRPLKVLDHGFVRVIDYMGDDAGIVQAARVSYGRGTKQVSNDRGLINYLMRHRHTTPFEMCEIKYHVKLPIFVARQWIRHRTANVNELSGRYSLIPMLFYSPPPEQLQTQSRKNNQGRSGDALDATLQAEAGRRWQEIRSASRGAYEWLTGQEVARELARIDLPLSTYTQWYWKIDLHNLLHFLTLRVDRHAQWEIRVFGQVMAGMLKRVAPLSYEAWIDYDVCGGHLSRHELAILRALVTPDAEGGLRTQEAARSRQALLEQGITGRELDEMLLKLRPSEVPDFELDLSQAKSAEYFAERFAQAVPGADRSPPEG